MLFFKTRTLAREFAKQSNHKLVDLGSSATKRWAVKVLKG